VHNLEWSEDYIRTVGEQKKNPYPDNLVTMCTESFTQDDDGKYYWLTPLQETAHRVYCRALTRTQDDDSSPLYTVEMDIEGSKQPIVVQDVEPSGIFLYNKAFSQDWHLPNVFRHEIMIPDAIMPHVWMNGRPPLDEYAEEDDAEEEEEDDSEVRAEEEEISRAETDEEEESGSESEDVDSGDSEDYDSED